MRSSDDPNTEDLIRRAGQGDQTAAQSLIALHGRRLRQMIAVRLDPRLARRVDPSDVVQEVLVEVVRRLPDYLRRQPLPFYPWLRQIAWEKLARLRRDHLDAERRSVHREVEPEMMLSDESIAQLAKHVAGGASSPSRQASRKETRVLVRRALAQMEEIDREVLVLGFLEHLDAGEVAAVLEITENAAKVRQFRALDRLGRLMEASEE
jgi:RNA polymerase sigma-70 factor, ECF subfamily